MNINRIIWIVLDSVGIGEARDAAKFGDEGADTLGHTAEANGGLDIPNMVKLGIGNIDGAHNLESCDNPIGCFGKLAEVSAGKDTTIGHWEMAGIYSPDPFPVYPDGFPDCIIDEFIKKTGIPGILCNKPASGTQIIAELGDEHVATGKPIVYTSGDSVFQIACHEDVVPVESLYEMCETARHILTGKNAVARVIARPFVGENGNYKRTPNRRDFSLKPSEDNILCRVRDKGLDVIGVGKFDDRLAQVLDTMKDTDMLVITADHGCDPTYKGTDHTREYVPLLVYGKCLKHGVNLGTGDTYADIAQTLAEIFGTEPVKIGKSFLNKIM